MNEDYLQYLWRFQRFSKAVLTCTSGQELSVIFPGHWNDHAGPDFLEAKLRIGREIWVGSVEVHIRSSDWKRHRHHDDDSYSNVVLHVVHEDDDPLVNRAQQEVPTIELKHLIDATHFKMYEHFLQSRGRLPCAGRLLQVDQVVRYHLVHRMAVERLEDRCSRVGELLMRYANDWNAVWWHLLCRTFGFGLNQSAFEYLAETLSWKLLMKLVGRKFEVEAVLLEHSAWRSLDTRLKEESNALRRYEVFRKIWKLQPAPLSVWRRGHMKPANHPRVRIGQLCALVENGWLQWRKVTSAQSLEEILNGLDVNVELAWCTMKGRSGISECLGLATRERIVANAVIPCLYHYARVKSDQDMIDQIMRWSDTLRPESNKIIRMWKELGWRPQSMLEAQGQMQLYSQYCCRKKCLSCLIGIHLLND